MTSPLLDNVAPPLPEADEPEARRPWWRLGDRWKNAGPLWPRRRPEPEPPSPSGYLTLIPLSDARLQPRDTRLTAAFLLLFAFSVAAVVFVLVPRSVSVGEISVAADRMSWNTSKASYQLRLVATIPVNNPNYLGASISGDLRVFFYSAEAGSGELGQVRLPPRALPKDLRVKIDASDVPSDYILSILSQCSTFPEVLVFFLKGRLQAKYLWMHQRLTTIDTYFMINCRDGGTDTDDDEGDENEIDGRGGGDAYLRELMKKKAVRVQWKEVEEEEGEVVEKKRNREGKSGGGDGRREEKRPRPKKHTKE